MFSPKPAVHRKFLPTTVADLSGDSTLSAGPDKALFGTRPPVHLSRVYREADGGSFAWYLRFLGGSLFSGEPPAPPGPAPKVAGSRRNSQVAAVSDGLSQFLAVCRSL